MKFLALIAAAACRLCGNDYLPHARATGAVTLVNLTGWQWGVEADESGINVESYDGVYRPEQKEYAKDRKGSKIGFAADEPEGEFTVKGEVTSGTGLPAATFTAAVTLANDHAEFGLSAGTVFLDEATMSQSRGGFRSLNLKLSKNKGIVLS